MSQTGKAASTADREILTVRVVDAPRDLVFKVWTEPAHVVKWWGPKGFTTTSHEMDVRPGGKWLWTMHGPDGTDYPYEIYFIDVVKPERLVYSHGKIGAPDSFHVTVSFVEQAGKTKINMHMVFNTVEQFKTVVEKYHADEGNKQMIDKLEVYMAEIQRRT